MYESQLMAFMGPIGGPEIVMILVMLCLLAIPAGIVIAVARSSKSRGKTPQPPQPPTSVEFKLAEIESLRSKNRISDAEYEERKKRILGEM